MQITALAIEGLYLILPDIKRDTRGFFTRTFDAAAFASHGLHAVFEQHSLSYNAEAGTLRGLHFQKDPHGETKLVQCVRGRIFDVAADVRPASSTYGTHAAVELHDTTLAMLLIPPGVAHGFQTLTPDATVFYRISGAHEPSAARTIHYQDPELNIPWPLPVTAISEKDAHAAPLASL